MAKNDGSNLTLHLNLGDDSAFDEILASVTDLSTHLTKAGNAFEASMENASKHIKGMSAAMEKNIGGRSVKQQKGHGMSDGGINRIRSSERAMVDAAEGVDRYGKALNNLEDIAVRVGASINELNKYAQSKNQNLDLEERIKLRQKAQAQIRKMISGIKKMGRAGTVSRESAQEMLQTIKDSQNQLSLAMADAEEAQRSISRRSLSEFKKQIRAERVIAEQNPGQAEEVEEYLRQWRQYEKERLQSGNDAVDASERILAIEREISKVVKAREKQREGQQGDVPMSDKSVTEYRKMLKARRALAQSDPRKTDSIQKQLRAEKEIQAERLRRNRDDIEAAEKLLAVEREIARVKKAQKENAEMESTQRAATDEKMYVQALNSEKSRLGMEKGLLSDEIERLEMNESVLRDIFGIPSAELKDARNELGSVEDALETLNGDRVKAAEYLLEKKRAMHREEEEAGDEAVYDEKARKELAEEILALERQIARMKDGQDVKSKQSGYRGGSGRRAHRRRMRENNTLSAYNAQLEMSRLIQDAPFGLMGMVNNLDMANRRMTELIKKSGSLKKALSALFFSSSAASGMLWINALTSGYMILDQYFDISDKIGRAWDDIYTAITGANASMAKFNAETKKAGEGTVSLSDTIQTGDAQERMQAISDKITEIQQKMVKNRMREAYSGGMLGDAELTQYVGYLFGGEGSGDQQMRDALEEDLERLQDLTKEASKLEAAFRKVMEVQGGVVKAWDEALQEEADLVEKILGVWMQGLDPESERAENLKQLQKELRISNKIADARERIREIRNVELFAAKEAGNEAAVADLERLIERYEQYIDALSRSRNREHEDKGNSARKKSYDDLFSMRRKTAIAEVEAQEESYEKERELVRTQNKWKKLALDEWLEDFEGTKEDEIEAVKLVQRQKIALDKQTKNQLLKLEKEHQAKLRKQRRSLADTYMTTGSMQVGLMDDGDDKAREQSEIQRRKAVIELERRAQDLMREGLVEQSNAVRSQIALENQRHQERLQNIRDENRQAQRAHDRIISDMLKQQSYAERRHENSQMYNGVNGQFNTDIANVGVNTDQRISEIQRIRDQEMQVIADEKDSMDHSIENLTSWATRKLEILQWYHNEKKRITEEGAEEVNEIEEEKMIAGMQRAAGLTANVLSNVSQGLADAQRVFVHKRKKALMEQGMAEEEAAKKAEEAGEKRFAAMKAVAIAQGLVATFQAALQVYANTPGEFFAKAAAMATALTVGFAQVQKIRAMSLGSTSAGSGGGPSLSGLSSSQATGSAVTDSSSPFSGERGRAPTRGREDREGRRLEKEVRGLRGDMERHTDAIRKTKSEAVISEDTVIGTGQAYEDHKEEDRY